MAIRRAVSWVSVIECIVFSALTAALTVVAIHLVGRASQPTPTAFSSYGSILIFTDRPDLNMQARVELNTPDKPTADEYHGSTEVRLALRFTDQQGQSPDASLHWLLAVGGWLKPAPGVPFAVTGAPEPLRRQSAYLLTHGDYSIDSFCIDIDKTQSPFCSSSLTRDPTSWAAPGIGGWVIASGTTENQSSCESDESNAVDDLCIKWRADRPIEVASGGRAFGVIPPIGTLTPDLVRWTYFADALLANKGKVPLGVYFTPSQMKTAGSVLDPRVFDPGGIKGKWAIPRSSEFDVVAVVRHSDQMLRVSPATAPDPNLRWNAGRVFPGAFWEANDEAAQSAASNELFLGGVFFGVAAGTAVAALERLLTVIAGYWKALASRRHKSRPGTQEPAEAAQRMKVVQDRIQAEQERIGAIQDRIETEQERIGAAQDRIETEQKRVQALQERVDAMPEQAEFPLEADYRNIAYGIALGAVTTGALLGLRRRLARGKR